MAHADPAELVRDLLAKGMSSEQIAAALRSAGVGPIEAVKALHEIAGIPLREGKELVDDTLPAEWRAATERLRDAAEQVLLSEGRPGEFGGRPEASQRPPRRHR